MAALTESRHCVFWGAISGGRSGKPVQPPPVGAKQRDADEGEEAAGDDAAVRPVSDG